MSDKNLIANLYNPHQQSPQALIDSFVVRLHTFQRVLRDIKEDDMRYPPQPLLIVGQRGMGKTTLLLRLGYEVEQDADLKDWLIPLVFTEELYGVTSLGRFWEKTAEYLEDKHPEFAGLADKMDAAFDANPARHEETSFQLLTKALQGQGKKLLLFIDNFNDIIDKFSEKENLRLREVLQTSADLRIIAASAVTIESFYRYDKPFYEFFKTIHLEGLNKEETYDLLRKLGENYKEESVKHILENQPGRVETLRRLSGGVIRSIVLLFEIFVDHENGTAFQDLERILDRVTPLYKHRMDDLSKQQQPIVDAIARSWDAVSTKDIAAATRLESKKVSAQLKQLTKNQVIQLVETPTKNHLYRIKERFFNIWYLMRLGSTFQKQKLKRLIEFYEEWLYGQNRDIQGIKSSYDIPNSGFAIMEERAEYGTKQASDETAFKESLKKIAGNIFFDPKVEKLFTHLLLLLAKKQYDFLFEFFTSPETQSLHPKDRFKPIWYALMHYMKDEYPHEYLKMGPELKETVEEIIAKVEEMRGELEN